MFGRKTAICVVVLCALAVSAVAASSASAAAGRLFTCAKEEPFEFNDAHCTTSSPPSNEYRHKLITKTTFVSETNEKTASATTAAEVSKLKGKIAGVATEVQCTGLAGGGEMTNEAASFSGTGTLEYSGCTVTAPAGRECKIGGGGVIKTKTIKVTTVGLANNNEVKIEMGAGETEFASIPIEGCKENSPPAGNYPVAGSVIATVTGGTTKTTHTGVTGQKTLTFGGNAAGIEGASTMYMNNFPEPNRAIVLT
jgi:hypothetical protein